MFLFCVIVACVLRESYATQNPIGLPKEELKELEEKVREECRVKHNVEKSVLEDIDKAFEDNKTKTLPETKDFKCMIGCFAEEMTYIKESKPQWNTMRTIHKVEYEDPKDLEKILKITDICEKTVPAKDEDNCTVGYEMAKCYITESDKIGLELL